MNATIEFNKVSNFLKGYDNILFALIFGSATKGKTSKLSDVDIGIYTTEEIPLLEIGKMVVWMEKIVKKRVDLVVLNDLFKQRPNFAFQVVSTARLLFAKDEDAFVNFKKNVYLYYLDTKPLIDMMKISLEKRIKTGNFGERNYA
ncbi:MAG: nucleotidyltransferase domain-containing protein [Candidatus Aminicenantes bacterium]|nr:nucleotidyltransferase domain-containing protein [Candidatus Aminicenantes bacterium]NIM84974.1 nucleotidyltransferase domain-containing protein [Candidatus Aminicenantes bacterium]NIN24488.1 nucleotidyltransferase domain-containing protein [Candidatus Aminicenantes bacterium]NIN48252.1 nucleotidyltransferase domain-containing protein [Candidatus Aminicenantes bacterium]NIN91155.1 nucleotidyltransferase domain-containing protein [Candidatus Aminicenantes bacterium]